MYGRIGLTGRKHLAGEVEVELGCLEEHDNIVKEWKSLKKGLPTSTYKDRWCVSAITLILRWNEYVEISQILLSLANSIVTNVQVLELAHLNVWFGLFVYDFKMRKWKVWWILNGK